MIVSLLLKGKESCFSLKNNGLEYKDALNHIACHIAGGEEVGLNNKPEFKQDRGNFRKIISRIIVKEKRSELFHYSPINVPLRAKTDGGGF